MPILHADSVILSKMPADWTNIGMLWVKLPLEVPTSLLEDCVMAPPPIPLHADTHPVGATYDSGSWLETNPGLAVAAFGK